MTDLPLCGNPKYGYAMGCGAPIESVPALYRCASCNLPMHKACLVQHFGDGLRAVPAQLEQLQLAEAELGAAQSRLTRYEEALRLLRALYESKVIGFNEDGSVWVFGGYAADGSLNYTYGGKAAIAPVWKKGERYAAAQSPFADGLRAALDTPSTPEETHDG